jgi:2-polyprenyl-3-methyl-5-hydroxy-6-metoxy-1,4-benzoquinol methylase
MTLAFEIFKILEKISRKPPAANETYIALTGSEEELDQTGRIVTTPIRHKQTVDKIRDLVFSNFENSVAHSYWRAQELSLFLRASRKFSAPVLDFGCGDGAFSACIFKQIDIGVDIDQKALEIAAGYGLYDKLITFEKMVNALENGSVGTVFSCSVLEHTTHLQDCIHQISRVLKPGGKFYFSVPNKNFTEQMTSLVDQNFASSTNTKMYHRNLLAKSEWELLLQQEGFEIDSFISFQPLTYTRNYFLLSLLGNRGFGVIPGVRKLYLKLKLNRLLDDLAASIDGTVIDGANYFVIASKRDF